MSFSSRGISILIRILAVPLSISLLAPTNGACNPGMLTVSSSSSPRAHLKRSHEVEEHYRSYSTRLQTAYRSLLGRLEEEAPQLVEDLRQDPPKRLRYGYQMLPQILADSPAPAQPPRPTSTSYSWPRTDKMIERQVWRIAALLEAGLEATAKMALAEKIPIYEKIIADYRKLKVKHRRIDRHIQHNRLWQTAVARDEASFKTGTFLHDTVVQRETVLLALGAEDEADFHSRIARIKGIDTAKTRTELEPELRITEQSLDQQIGGHSSWFKLRPFLRVDQPEPHVWVLKVPMTTDIESESFIQWFKDSVEKFWQVEAGSKEFRVELSIIRVSSEELYQSKRGCTNG